MKKKIGMILDVSRGFLPDIRVEKEARVFIKGGFEVSLLAEKADSSQTTYEKLNYRLEIFRTGIQSQQDFFHKVLTNTIHKHLCYPH